MKHSTSCIPLIALVLLLSQTIAIAGSLTITVRMTIQEFKDHIKVAITVTNDGPDTAYRVGAKLYTLEQTWTAGAVKELAVKDTEIFTFKPLLSKNLKGRYPIAADVIFHDKYHHPFSSLSCTTYKLKEDTRTIIEGTSGDISIYPRGNLILKLNNPEGIPKKVKVTLVLPSVIKTDIKRQTLHVGRKQETLIFPVSNHKALLGSQHPYYFFLEYDQDGQHYSSLTGGKINVGDIRVNWFIRTRWYWLSGLGTWLLIWGIWGLVGVIGKMRGRSKGDSYFL